MSIFFQKNLPKIKLLLKDLALASLLVGLALTYLNHLNPGAFIGYFVAQIALIKFPIFLLLYFFIDHLTVKFLPKTKYTPVPKDYLKTINTFIENRHSLLLKISSYLLIFLISLLFLDFINFNLKIKIKPIKNLAENIEDLKIYLIIATTLTGILFFKLNSSNFKKIIQENKEEKDSEEKRKLEFLTKFPTINKIPLFRSLIKRVYQEGWKYSIGLISILIIFTTLGAYKLGDFEIRGDEYQVVAAATTFYKTGEFYKWDWLENKSGKYTSCIEEDKYCNYTRAWPHTVLIAQAYKIFGINEWSSRIVSLISGMFFIIIVYFFTKYFFESKKIALLATLTLALHPDFLIFFRYARMYAILAPIFLLLIFYLYRITTESNNLKNKNTKVKKFIQNNFDFNFKLLPIALVLLFFNYHIHINSLVAIPSLALFIFLLTFKTKNKKYLWASLICLFGITITIIAGYLGYLDKFTYFLSFFEKTNYRYIFYQSRYPFGESLGISLFLILFFSMIFYLKIKKNKLIFIFTNIFFPLAFFIWIADRYANVAYGSHIIILSIITISASFYYLVKINKNLILKFFLISIFTALMSIIFFNETLPRLYGEENTSVDFKIAYKTITNNFDPENQVIFGQYLRDFYLKDINSDKKIETINMLNYKQYPFEKFLEDLKKHPSGYLTWEKRKRGHLESSIRRYCCENFQQLHGDDCEEKIDDTKIEVFYFNKSMIK